MRKLFVETSDFSGTLSLFYGFELYHFNDLTFDPKRPKGAFNSYTAFRKRVEEGSQVRASNLEKLSWRMNVLIFGVDSTVLFVYIILYMHIYILYIMYIVYALWCVHTSTFKTSESSTFKYTVDQMD